jgi:hypothetical protein
VSTSPRTYTVLGSDIALTRYSGVPSSVRLEFADSWGTLDLQVVPGGGGGLAQAANAADLGAVTGRENLAQALILRLLTHRGSLAGLGHPDYGSRLVELIGRLNDDTTRNLARMYTMEAVAQERRVARLLDLAVTPVIGQPDSIEISFSVVPVDDDTLLALALEVAL